MNILKRNHINAIESLSSTQIHWKLVLMMLFLIGGSVVLVYMTPLFGVRAVFDQQLSELVTEEFAASIRPWLVPALYISEIISEVIWVLIWVFITKKILEYVKKPLSFIHILNVFLVARLYEVVLSLALLLALSGVILLSGETATLSYVELGTGTSFIGFAITVLFVWTYIWSIRYLADKYKDKTAQNNTSHS